MKPWYCLILAVTLLLSAGSSSAMSVKLVSGDLKPLKTTSLVRVEYVYPADLRVGKMSELEYVAKKTREYNEKTPGRGDQWARMWVADRANHFHPKFEELMNRTFAGKKKDLRVASTADDPEYTLIVRLTWLEPGWHVGIAARPAFLDAEITLVRTADRGHPLAKILVRKSPGRGVLDVGYAAEQRLAESFAKCGKEVAQLLLKRGLK